MSKRDCQGYNQRVIFKEPLNALRPLDPVTRFATTAQQPQNAQFQQYQSPVFRPVFIEPASVDIIDVQLSSLEGKGKIPPNRLFSGIPEPKINNFTAEGQSYLPTNDENSGTLAETSLYHVSNTIFLCILVIF